MGMGYSYICKKCGHKYSVCPGVGMMYPQVYRQKLAEIAEGAYGMERKNLFQKTPYAAINAETIIYFAAPATDGRPEQTLLFTHMMILKAFRINSMG